MGLEDVSVNERLTKLETKVEEHSKLLDKQQDRNEILIEMKTLLKMQTDVNSEQNKQMKEFNETLQNVNENLTNLNISQQQMKMDMNEIGNRVEEIEKKADEHKIDPMKIIKQLLSYLATAVGSIAIAYIIWKLGIKN